MFTKRNEHELAEIKALTYELGQRVQEIQDQLAGIREAQARLAGGSEASTAEGGPSSDDQPAPQHQLAAVGRGTASRLGPKAAKRGAKVKGKAKASSAEGASGKSGRGKKAKKARGGGSQKGGRPADDAAPSQAAEE